MKFANKNVDKLTRRFSALIWRLLEIHIFKAVALTIFLTCLREVRTPQKFTTIFPRVLYTLGMFCLCRCAPSTSCLCCCCLLGFQSRKFGALFRTCVKFGACMCESIIRHGRLVVINDSSDQKSQCANCQWNRSSVPMQAVRESWQLTGIT